MNKETAQTIHARERREGLRHTYLRYYIRTPCFIKSEFSPRLIRKKRVRKTSAFRNSRKMPQKRQKARENTPILQRKGKRPFSLQLVLYVLHQVRRLTVENRAYLVKRINRQMLYCSGADCRNCRRTDAGFLREFFLCHFAHREHYFYFEFYHINTAFLVIPFYHVLRNLSIRKTKNNYVFYKEITKSVLTNYEFRGIIYTVRG